MKKYINKLFEWLGYVPKDSDEGFYFCKHQDSLMIAACMRAGTITYRKVETYAYWIVVACCNLTSFEQEVKVFPKGDTEDSADYARICAEELCEMLNEKY
jgi:hypothetical protein